MRTVVRAAAVIFTSLAATAHADYAVTDLTPAGSVAAQAFAISGGRQAGAADVAGNSHAFLWNATAPGADLHPTGPDSSLLLALSPTQAAGLVFDNNIPHAALWTLGGTTPFQRLPDSAYTDSQATSLAGSIIAGLGTAPTTINSAGGSHALLWTNPALAPIDLHPATATYAATAIGYASSSAAATDGNRIVGSAALDNPTNDPHAALWNLTANTFTDLHPNAGFLSSNALAISGNQIVGYALQDSTALNAATHALLWTLSGANDSTITLTDLHPAGFDQSFAAATNGSLEVGFATDSALNDHAILWQSPTSSLDLSQYLPPGAYKASHAYGIDAQGNIVGDAIDLADHTHAILWSPASSLPEPTSALLLALPATLFLRRRRPPGKNPERSKGRQVAESSSRQIDR